MLYYGVLVALPALKILSVQFAGALHCINLAFTRSISFCWPYKLHGCSIMRNPLCKIDPGSASDDVSQTKQGWTYYQGNLICHEWSKAG